MYIAMYTEANLLAAAVLLMIWYKNRKQKNSLYFTESRVFNRMVLTNLALLFIDVLMLVFNGRPGEFSRMMNRAATFAFYCAYPLLFSLWMTYCDAKLFSHRTRMQRLYLIPAALIILLNIVNIFVPLIYVIGADNQYMRMPHLYSVAAVSGLCIIVSAALTIGCWMRYRDGALRGKIYLTLLAFCASILFCGCLQTLVQGFNFVWLAMTVMLLIIFINLQNQQIFTDPLTGLFNRRQLMLYLKGCVLRADEKTRPYIIMADMDDFKRINDEHGHLCGDEALREVGKILRASVRLGDFVARYGGDEFVIVPMLEDDAQAKEMISRISEKCDSFNKNGSRLFKLHISLGYCAYDESRFHDADSFLRSADARMYENKAERKRRRERERAQNGESADKAVDKKAE